MKAYLIILLFLLSPLSLLANRIDALKTADDVERFVVSLDTLIQQYEPKDYCFTVIPHQQLIGIFKNGKPAEIAQINSWQKIDLNGDGRTDLLVHANWFNKAVFVVMDMGAGKYKDYRIRPHQGNNEGEIAIPAHIGKQVCLLLNGNCCVGHDIGYCKDTLVYKNEGFVEYEAHPARYEISKITFTANGCPMGECLRYKMQINEDKSARYVASSYIPNQGVFTGTVPPQVFVHMMDLLNYIRVKKIRHRFEDCSITDAGGWSLDILYKDGTKTNLYVYAEQAPYGLLAIEDIFAALRRLPNWEQIK
jgi:hypothetical protein